MAEQRRSHQLRQRVEDALMSYPPLRESRCPIEVSVRDGVVELRGVVRTIPMKSLAEQIARSVPGVKDVLNNLITDTEIEWAVARQLSRDGRTQPWSAAVRVCCIRGCVKLKGDVPAEARESLLQVAKGVPGVREAEFDLRAAPV